MTQTFLYIHVLSAVLMGFYLVLPLLAFKISAQLEVQGKKSQLELLFSLNRFGQLAVVIAFLSGGYLVSQAEYPTLWWILAILLLLAIAAVGGILGSNMRKVIRDSDASEILKRMGKIRSLSVFACLLYFLMITLMLFPNVFI
ncbi:hypothetical protein [Paenibacillus sp. FSL H8-0537]|uniref:hypothetical protein n=1 Tax=Paenibacillus sp. FSL H8-0537 TaxID=2921399 RepID=UPI003100FFC3